MHPMRSISYLGVLLALLLLAAVGAPMPAQLTEHAAPDAKLVFAHFMLAYPTGKDLVDDYKADIACAQKYHIDGFALNMGALPQDEAHNDYLLRADKLYQAAAQLGTGFKLFISVDTSSLVDPTLIQHVVTRYASHPNQLFYLGRQFLATRMCCSINTRILTEISNGFPGKCDTMHLFCSETVSKSVYSCYGLRLIHRMHVTPLAQDLSEDTLFRQYSAKAGKTFMQGMRAQRPSFHWIAPWFFCHLPDKNWGNIEDGYILVDKWESILTNNPDFVEFVTWNGAESTYLAPPNSVVINRDYSWATFDHTALLDLSSYYHLAFKTGQRPKITASVPIGGAQEEDVIYVVAMLTKPGTVIISSGGSSRNFTVGAGITKLSMPFNQGQQKVELKRLTTTELTSIGS
ncbi:glycosyl hydrolase family 71-domain-containing protein, partial [Jimgerdemannia flammicorona]